MKIGKYIIGALLVLCMASMVYAAPVGLTSEADAAKAEWQYGEITLNAGFLYDSVNRDINIDSGDFEMSVLTARLGLSALERFNIYVDLGQAQDMEYTFRNRGDTITITYEDEFMWGVGASALIYRWNNGLEIGANVSYRTVDTGIDKATINSVANTTYTRNRLTGVTDGDYEETTAALEVGWRTNYFIPYLGIKFSDVDLGSKFTADGTTRDGSGKDSSETVGTFVGLTITPKIEGMPKSEQVAINVEGRFIDEEAFSAGINYKF